MEINKNISRGKKARRDGKIFENKVRDDLRKDWIVLKWSKNVDLIENKLVDSKPKFNPFTKSLQMNSSGFPDYLTFKFIGSDPFNNDNGIYNIEGVECKSNGVLDKEEKEKCDWLLNKDIFSKIWIAEKSEKGKGIYYREFKRGESLIDKRKKEFKDSNI